MLITSVRSYIMRRSSQAIFRQLAQGFARQLSCFVPWQSPDEPQRAGQKHWIDACPQGLLDLFRGFTRRDHKRCKPRDGPLVSVREKEHTVLDSFEFQ